MTKRRQRLFWLLATVMLPPVNPVGVWVISYLIAPGNGQLPLWVAIAVLVGETAGLASLARRNWPKPGERQWRMLLAGLLLVVLSIGAGVAELICYLLYACSGGNCFS